jgi:anti-sigma regulatory factor (Ser/Thr protein kinase)
MTAPVKLTVRSQPSHLRVVRSVVERMCEIIGFDDAVAGRIVLSVDEAMTNIIRHAYDGAGDEPIEIELSSLDAPGGGLRVTLRDWGRRVERSRIRPRDLADVRPGGLGVHIIASCMDRMDYQPADGGGTMLILEKKLSTGCPPAAAPKEPGGR